jgi:hypothetical protein
MVDGFHFELAAEILHSAGFQLEHRDRVAAVEQIVGSGIVERNIVPVELDAAME